MLGLEIRKKNQADGEVLSTDIDGTKETDKALDKDTKMARFASTGTASCKRNRRGICRLTAENGKEFWTETISDEGK